MQERKPGILVSINRESERLANICDSNAAESRLLRQDIKNWGMDGSKIERISKLPAVIAATFSLSLIASFNKNLRNKARWISKITNR